MNRVRSKLNSRRGASISFGLLLFLVCAVVSAIVITAATASAGRMSQMARMDQRYYAVTSAADLLRKKIDGKTLEVTYDLRVDPDDLSKTIRVPRMVKPIDSPLELDDKILKDATEKLIVALPNINSITNEYIDKKDFQLTCTLPTGAPKGVQLNCKIVEMLRKDRLLTFEITSDFKDAMGNADKQAYKLYLTFSSDVRELAVDAGATEGQIIVTWKLLSLQKHRPGTTI